MADTKEQILSFLTKCDELKKCKFIMATTKIKDVLKCIVNCPDLYRLFSSVTKQFNYPAMKQKCLVISDDGYSAKCYITLPRPLHERLAFLFCLLVEFDKDSINLNDFLARYFTEDGSYVASYRAFCDGIIKPLEEGVLQAFEDKVRLPSPDVKLALKKNSMKSELLSVLSLAITEEIQHIESCHLAEEDLEGGKKILTELLTAIKEENVGYINAIACGYNYFVLYNRCVSEGVATLLQTIAAYVNTL